MHARLPTIARGPMLASEDTSAVGSTIALGWMPDADGGRSGHQGGRARVAEVGVGENEDGGGGRFSVRRADDDRARPGGAEILHVAPVREERQVPVPGQPERGDASHDTVRIAPELGTEPLRQPSEGPLPAAHHRRSVPALPLVLLDEPLQHRFG